MSTYIESNILVASAGLLSLICFIKYNLDKASFLLHESKINVRMI